MTREFILVLLLSFIGIRSFSQENIFEKEIQLEYVHKDKRKSCSIINSEDSKFCLVLLDYRFIRNYFFNKELNLFFENKVERPNSKFSDVIGNNYYEGFYNIYFSTKKRNTFYMIGTNQENGQIISEELNVKLKGEKFLQAFSHRSRFYVLSIKTLSSTLVLNIIKNNKEHIKKEFNFSNYKYLSGILTQTTGNTSSNSNVAKIYNSTPTSLALSSFFHKAYCYDNKMLLSMDNNNQTELISIDLDNFSSRIDTFIKPKIEVLKWSPVKSNSFIYHDILCQVKVSDSELSLSIQNINNQNIKNEFVLKKHESININNTPMIDSEGKFNSLVGDSIKMEKINVILHEISKNRISVTAFKLKNNLVLTIGSTKINYKSGSIGNVPFAIGTPQVGMDNTSYSTFVSINYLGTSLGNYEAMKENNSFSFKSLFNIKNLQHIEGEVKSSVYQNIINHIDSIGKKTIAHNIFNFNENQFLGYYRPDNKTFYLKVFSE